jgi:hypothetical protein
MLKEVSIAAQQKVSDGVGGKRREEIEKGVGGGGVMRLLPLPSDDLSTTFMAGQALHDLQVWPRFNSGFSSQIERSLGARVFDGCADEFVVSTSKHGGVFPPLFLSTAQLTVMLVRQSFHQYL